MLFATVTAAIHAQAVHSGVGHQFSITTGGIGSIFQPDFAGEWPPPNYYPAAQASSKPLFGLGAYVDVRLSRWVQLEGEARWMRFNQYESIHQDNYLIGPKLPVCHFGRSNVYAKTLVGFSNMNFYGAPGYSGRFTDVAFGGGMDMKLTKRISLRAVDVEYQYWPQWENSSLSPYGASVGIGYKIF